MSLRSLKLGAKEPGLSPGTLVHIGERKVGKPTIRILEYDEAHVNEVAVEDIDAATAIKPAPVKSWINMCGIHDEKIVKKIGAVFNLHPLLLEDVMHTGQRSKVEDFGETMFIVLKMLYYHEEEQEVRGEQISIVLGTNFVISFQESEDDAFYPVLERIGKQKGKIRSEGSDYCAYALVDAVVDHYFVILERLGQRIEEIEEALLSEPRASTLQEIHRLRRELIFIQKLVWPLREVVGVLERGESPLVQQATRIYLRDVYDHVIQVIDTVESFREMATGMLEMYLSSVSNRMNEVMKMLTIIATIFIPLSFLAGIYGMNFEYMPELEWRWGYPAIWAIMVCAACSMVVYFWKRRWL